MVSRIASWARLRKGFADQRTLVLLAERVGHDHEEQADQDRREPVPEPLAGDVVQRDADRGEDDADQRRGVLEGHRLRGGVGGDLEVLEEPAPLVLGLAAELSHGLEPRDALEQEAQRQDHVGDQQAAELLGLEHRLDALEDRVAGTQHEDADRGDQRPEVALHPVAERVQRIGRLLAALQRCHQEDLVERVGEGVRRLGQHRRGAGDQPTDELGDRDREVGAAGEQDGSGGFVVARVVGHAPSQPAAPPPRRAGPPRLRRARPAPARAGSACAAARRRNR